MAGRRRSVDNDTETIEELNSSEAIPSEASSKRKELNLIRHTETIDRLVIQNKSLQKDLDEADDEIVDLETRLSDHSVRISKNMLYTIIIAFGIMIYMVNAKLMMMSVTMVETKHIMQEYKQEIEKVKLYNDILKDKLKQNKE